ncbi:MAG: M23 family metallopeptidase [Candidatus Harrisonbacteria bacterium]|nr:M23 family metallopeptidase [Candidatus Harrisonbacteria bacterium]
MRRLPFAVVSRRIIIIAAFAALIGYDCITDFPTKVAESQILGGPEEQALFSEVFLKDNSEQILSTSVFSLRSGFFLSGEVSEGAERERTIFYKARAGETAGEIAARYGVSLETIVAANPELMHEAKTLGGERVVIPPMNGIFYTVKSREDAVMIASRYGLTLLELEAYNKNQKIKEGVTIFVPKGILVSENTILVRDGKATIAIPASGWNWGALHYNNAVDIANECGTPVFAATEGEVIRAEVGWNNGYGTIVIVMSPEGIETRYAHLKNMEVVLGTKVSQGEKLGLMGNTGKTHGVTGCHLHFEVLGAENPLVKHF